MTTRLQGERIREEMRSMLSGKATVMEVRKVLGLSRSTYYRQLEVIKEQDQEWLTELARGEFTSEFRKAHDTLEALERRLLHIADTAPRDRDKIEAARLCIDAELDRIALLAEGPTALAIRRRTKKELVGEPGEVQKAA